MYTYTSVCMCTCRHTCSQVYTHDAQLKIFKTKRDRAISPAQGVLDPFVDVPFN